MAAVMADLASLEFTFSDEASASFVKPSAAGFIHMDQQAIFYMDICSCKAHDVIVLAEFSEIKGPISLLTIPLCLKRLLDVDLDDFILKIMSVDYQANSSGHFRFSDDTRVLQTEVVGGVHAYVHYFSLNDIQARGFVRPLCLAYITKNLSKLESNVSILRDQFLKVSSAMKSENRALFLDEVSINLQYLKDIQQSYFQWKQRLEDDVAGKSEEDSFMENINLDQLVDQQTEYSYILQSGKLLRESEEILQVLSQWRSIFSESDEIDIDQYVTFVKSNMVSIKPQPLFMKSNMESSLRQLRPIALISPFGIAVGLWNLCTVHTLLDKCALELMGGCFWSQNGQQHKDAVLSNAKLPIHLKEEVFNAMADDVYRQLLMQLIPSKPTLIPGNDQCDSYIFNQFASGNEASSSYYSAPESINDAPALYQPESVMSHRLEKTSVLPSHKTFDSSGSSDSMSELGVKEAKTRRKLPVIADDWSSDSSDSVEHNECEVFEFPAAGLWFKCIWSGNVESPRAYPGPKILHFFEMFSKVAQHILYSFLIGRTVVIAGSANIRHKVIKIISAMVFFVPVQKDSKYLRWHKGILISAHIEKYKIIGLCVPERLTVHDMISPRDKNCVTILDVNTKQIFGPAYSGLLLGAIEENFHRQFLSDESLILYLQAVFKRIEEKVFLYQAVISGGTSQNLTKSHSNMSSIDILHCLSMKGCDANIIKYLQKLMVYESYF